MEVLLFNLTATFAFAIIIFYCILRYRAIAIPLFLGGLARLVLSWLIGLDILELPGTTSDARTFERRAREWSLLPWQELFNQFSPASSYVISFVGAIIYKLTVPSPVLLNLINGILSFLLIIMSYKLAREVWGDKSRGVAAAWIIALFPFAMLYGSVFRREVFGSFFFMIAIFKSLRWLASKNPVALLIAVFYFVVAGIFHSGYLVGVFGLILFVMVATIKPFLTRSTDRSSMNTMISGAIAGIFFVGMLGAALSIGFTINKLGDVSNLDVAAAIEYRVEGRVSDGTSSYPDFLRGVNPFSNPVVLPGRFIYFLFSPFPWDIRAMSHVPGLMASVYFILLGRSIFYSRKKIYKNKKAILLFMIVIASILVFSISIDNVGTSVRHRTKFIYPLVALCAVPLFQRFRLFSKRNRAIDQAASS